MRVDRFLCREIPRFQIPSIIPRNGPEPPKLHGQMISLGSNHLVYQDMYTFKYDFSWVKTNVVSVNLWIIIFASIDLIKDNCDV